MKAVPRIVDLWQNKFMELLEEARLIQKRLLSPSLHNYRQADKVHNFAENHAATLSAIGIARLNKEQSGDMLPLTRKTC